ncbi:MAG TPA: hypothetical protein VOA41_01660 [Candidatus Dormibacteraeota bacterium]|nr:hypothetical protein [Candidatus Dormibacteraeota bacterium]
MTSRNFVAFGLAVFLAAHLAAAYQKPLESRSIREAYFLGQRNDEAMQKFLATYMRRFPIPPQGPHVAEIELLTPYAQVVKISQRKSVGYSAQQAEQEYSERGDRIAVRVLILFTNTYSLILDSPNPGNHKGILLRSPDFWRDFDFRLLQEDEMISAEYVSGEPQYLPDRYSGTSALSGATVYLDYDAGRVKSIPTRVQVLTSDGQRVTAEFDLAKLR